MRITTGMMQRNTLADINRVNERVERAQSRASSNKQIEKPSDDPFGTARALRLRGSLAGVQEYQASIQDAQGWQEAASLGMGTVTEIVHRARSLLVQGSSSTADPVSRASIAAEMDELINAAKQAGNTAFQGRFIFGGTRTDQPPYLDGAVDAYQGSAAVVARQVGPGVSLEIGVTGESFLGNGGGDGKLLDTLRNIAAHMRSGDTASMQGTDLQSLDANLDELLGVSALNGARQNRLDAALSRMDEIEEATTIQLSETEDADIAATLIELTSQQNAYQAALKVGANVIQASLMDFLR